VFIIVRTIIEGLNKLFPISLKLNMVLGSDFEFETLLPLVTFYFS
jgi:hypothetical protein